MSTTYFITGANRGLGRAAVEKYLSRDNVTVLAAVRNLSDPSSQSLAKLPKGSNSKLVAIALDSSNFEPEKLAKELDSHGIRSIDVVLSSAGIAQSLDSMASTAPADILRHVEVNAFGTLAVFQATAALLEAAPNPKFAVFGSALGSIGGMDRRAQYPGGAYGASKALVHWIVRRVHFEHPKITAIVIDPGFVQTDMGNAGAKAAGLDKAFDEVEATIDETIRVIDSATKETTSGRYIPTGKSSQVQTQGQDFPCPKTAFTIISANDVARAAPPARPAMSRVDLGLTNLQTEIITWSTFLLLFPVAWYMYRNYLDLSSRYPATSATKPTARKHKSS